jgi:uncharacterized protein YndB with AHSA1/START domain
MTQLAQKSNVRAIVVEDVLPHSAETIWRVLTTPELLSRWLMSNNFVPKLGQRFSFTDTPVGDWNGVVQCEILEIDPPHRLVYSWVGGSMDKSAPESALDSTLSFTLTPTEGGTRFKLVHDGFRSPQNDAGYEALSHGWASSVQRIDALARKA